MHPADGGHVRASRHARGQPAAWRPAQARSGAAHGAGAAGLHVRRTHGRHEPRRSARDPEPDPRAEEGQDQDHPAGGAQDGRGARAGRPHHRADQRHAGGRRPTGRGDRIARGAGSLPRCNQGGRRMTTTTNNTGNLLELQGVHTHIGAYHILHGVDLAVPKGQLTMLLGRNGAGKTTTLRTIMGLWHASKGSVHFAGKDITALNTPQIAGMNIAYVPENMGIFADLTVKENMLLAARSARNAAQMDEARLQWIFKLFPAVEKFWNHPAGKLSGGQKQMVAVSRAIVEPRDLLIVDEPSKGLAPAIINNMIEAFDQLKKSGVTILLVEQNINFAKRLGDTVAVMDNGQVVHAGSMAALAEDEALQRSLLGLAL